MFSQATLRNNEVGPLNEPTVWPPQLCYGRPQRVDSTLYWKRTIFKTLTFSISHGVCQPPESCKMIKSGA